MSSTKPVGRANSRWFAIGKPLPSRQRSILTLCSFLIPLAVWSAVSYLPFVWHPDIKLTISAEREGISTIYTRGDHLSKSFFPTFVAAVKAENAAVLAARAAGEPIAPGRRSNLKTLRHIAAWGIGNGYLTAEEAKNDDAIFQLWARAAKGDFGKQLPLSPDNIKVVKENWILIKDIELPLSSRDLPNEALLKLIPQGKSSNPVYLPAPHEVLLSGYQDFFTEQRDPDDPSMWQRALHSMKIVFGGFLLAAIVGVPIAILCGTFDFFSRIFEPFIDFFRYLPAPAFSTLLVAVFLAHDAPKIALVFVGTFFQLVLVVANTTREIDRSLIEASQTLGADRRNILLRVIVPGILPQLYNDLRILLGWAWTWLVIAELIGVKSGLTEFIETQGRWRNFDRVFPVIILIGFIGFFTDQILSWLRVFLFKWTGESPNAFSRVVASSVAAGPRWFQREVLDQRLDPLADRRNKK
ncbi:ABC transporter permease [Pelagicoccus sp. SDUM812005]|uniref:ABC transporter permease n=1 Tax=Pelagicoccus sp. SDUM812005 TaxID=3041257 RepID=UPI0028102BCC|nr:ABC transporter permease [Pelagicoccus sp. SDUM812005]MDQ8180565.1 ABC transporter permease [Pelagicoccus sp. SDUM812005]